MSVQLILRADIANLGRVGAIVSVKRGYARNFLIPKGIAMLATPANQRVFELERERLQLRMDAVCAKARNLAEQIEAVQVSIPMRVGAGGKLYGSVTRSDIIKTLGKILPDQVVEIDRRMIQFKEPIRALGFFEVIFKLHADVRATLKVRVVNYNACDVVATHVPDASVTTV